MTEVTLEDGKTFRVTCEGHATGNQDVCSAVSCLMCTAAIWLEEHPEELCHVELEEGRAFLEFTDRRLFEFLSVGLTALIENFPKFIRKRGL